MYEANEIYKYKFFEFFYIIFNEQIQNNNIICDDKWSIYLKSFNLIFMPYFYYFFKMTQDLQVQLKTTSVLDLPLQFYDKDFTFIVNGTEYPTSRVISDLLSPYIR